jgi:UDP-2,3-diacylglucosamine hydrolase
VATAVAPPPRAASGGERPVLFVSDLHLAEERPQAAAAFRDFLRGPAREASAVYILGDLFEYWIGDDEPAAFNRGILDALAETADAGTALHFLHGNRDFLVGRRAARRSRLHLLTDPTLVELFGVPTLLMHGDTLCTDDIAYQTARARWRRPAVIAAFLALPLFARRRIAQRLRDVSERTKAGASPTIMDVNVGAVEQALRIHGYPRLIHGHTHRPATHVHHVDGQRCERIVLGDWYESGSYLRVDSGGTAMVPIS